MVIDQEYSIIAVFKLLSITLIIVIMIVGCGLNSSQEIKPFTIGFLNSEERTLYYLPDQRSQVIQSIQGMGNDFSYEYQGHTYTLEGIESEEIEVEVAMFEEQALAFYSDTAFQVAPFPAQVVRKNLYCGINIPANKSKCKKTFGRHVQFGKWMIRNRGAYVSCAWAEDSICTETFKQVGRYTYWQSQCAGWDTLFITKPIMRWSCK